MRNEGSPPQSFRYARAAEVAARQWGNVTTAQLRAIGFSKGAIVWMVQQGLLTRRHRGVFAFGAPSRAPESKWAAALLAAGEGSALCRTSAASFYGQLPLREVTEVVATTRRRGGATLTVSVARRVEIVERRGMRVTTPAQTLLDLAATKWPIDRMTHDLAAGGHVSLDDLRAFADRRRGEPGARLLREALALPHTRSNWERDFVRWVKRVEGIPEPVMNDRIGHLTVDVHWPEHNLIIELDTDQTHGSAWKRRDDAERDAWLESIGKEVWRVQTIEPRLEARLRQRFAPRHIQSIAAWGA